MADLMKHNMSFSLESVEEYFIMPLMGEEEYVKMHFCHVLGRLPRKQKKELKKKLKKDYGYSFKAKKTKLKELKTLDEITRIYENPKTIKTDIK